MVRSTVLFLIAGALVLALVLASTDLAQTWRHVSLIGWGFAAVLALYGLEFLAATLLWQTTFSSLPANLRSFHRLWRTQMVGEALNHAMAHVGGEAIKAVVLKHRHGVPYQESLAAMVLSRTLLVTALVLFLAAGLALMLQAPALGEGFRALAYVGLAMLAATILLLVGLQRFRLVSRIVRLVAGARGQGLLQEVLGLEDRLLAFYRTRRAALLTGFALGLANWLLGVVTLYVTFHLLGVPVSLTEAWIMEAFTQLARVASAFVPAHLGAQEGALTMIAGALTGNPAAGLAAALVRRGRELVWILWGLALGWNDWTHVKALRAGRQSALP